MTVKKTTTTDTVAAAAAVPAAAAAAAAPAAAAAAASTVRKRAKPAAAPAAAAVAAAPVAAAPVAAAAEPAPAPAPAAAAAAASPPTTAADIVAVVNASIETLRAQVVIARAHKERDLAKAISDTARQLGTVRKPIEKLEKAHTKKRRTSTLATGEERKTGFKKPTEVSAELCEFLHVPVGELLSRVDVTRGLCKYIKDHELQNPQNKREILVDDKLAKLLLHDKATPLTYYTLQQRIQKHFVKTTVMVRA